jgi:hypothetical protein
MKRFRRAAYSLMLAYAALLATQRGEFFPFSLFPMFSKAGRPWERAIVRELTTVPACAVDAEQLPGSAVALAPLGLDQNDVSKALLRIREMSDQAAAEQTLARLFAGARASRPLAIYQARGSLDAARSVRVILHLLGTIDGERAQLARGCGP